MPLHCMHACMFALNACLHCMLVYDLRECIFLCFAEALYEKKQRTMAYGPEVAKLQAQVEQWEAAAKGSQGKVIR